jgi:hypothetical protein
VSLGTGEQKGMYVDDKLLSIEWSYCTGRYINSLETKEWVSNSSRDCIYKLQVLGSREVPFDDNFLPMVWTNGD